MSPVPPDTTREAATGNSPAGDLTLAGLEREFGWTCWDDGDQCYARHPLTAVDDYDARGDDPADLREAMLLAFPEDAH